MTKSYLTFKQIDATPSEICILETFAVGTTFRRENLSGKIAGELLLVPDTGVNELAMTVIGNRKTA